MAASEKQLGELHAQVANALAEQVKGYEIVEDGKTTLIRPSPALLGAAIAYLKNNNITADATENEALRDLSKKLADRRRGKIPQAALDEAAETFATVHAGGLMQ